MTGDERSEPILIAEWRKNARECVRVTLDRFSGMDLIAQRVFYEHAPGDMRPSRKGLSLSVKHLPQLIESLREAEAKARELGLIE